MTINLVHREESNVVEISITERFDFSLHQDFREMYKSCVKPGAIFQLDLSRTDYIDSSALGMILLLKDHAEQLAGQVVIAKPSSTVSKILKIAQFDKLMDIIYA